jgi:hypothetical protein
LVSFELEGDLLMALEALSDALGKATSGRRNYLKWSIIFSHNALQSAMCLSLETSATFLVRKRSSYGKENGELDNIEWLYAKLRKPEFLPYLESKVIPECEGELSLVQRLQIVRNTFIHQQPDLYVFDADELYSLIGLALKLTRFLVGDSERMLFSQVDKAILEGNLLAVESQLARR